MEVISVEDKAVKLSKISQVIQAEEIPSNEPDAKYALGLQTFEEARKEIEIQELRTKLANLKSAFKLSTRFAILIFILVFAWLGIVLGIVIWQGAHQPLSNSVLIALLSTTTANMISLLYLVIRYVFNHRLKI